MNSEDGKSILRYIAYAALFAMPFVVFLVPTTLFFPFITGKAVAFRLLAEVGFAAWAMLAIMDPAYRPRRSWFLAALAILIAWFGVTTLTAIDPLRSFWSTYERMDGYVTLLHLGMYAVTMMGMLTTTKIWDRYLATTWVASIGISLFALAQLSGHAYASRGTNRIDATLGNPTYLAIYVLFHIFIVAILMRRYWQYVWVRWAGAATILLHLYILIKTGTRGSLLGLIGGIAMMAIVIALFDRERPRIRKWAVGAILGIIVLISGFIALRDTEAIQSVTMFRRLANISLEDDTTQSRLFIWSRVAWEGVKERPLLGWGHDNFNTVFNKYYDPRLYDQEQWFDRSHNVIMDWTISGGIPGMLLYCGLFLALLWMIWRPGSSLNTTERALLTGALAGYTIHNLFVFDNVVSYIIFMMFAAYIHVRTSDDVDAGRLFEGWTPSRALVQTSYVLVPVVAIAAMYSFAIRPLQGASQLVGALRIASGAPNPSGQNPFEMLTEVIDITPYGAAEVLSQTYNIGSFAYASDEIEDEAKQILHERNVELTEAEIARSPETAARTWFLYGAYLQSVGRPAESETAIRNALALSPAKQTMMFGLVNALLNQGKAAEAEEVAQTAFELDTRFGQARDAYALMLVRNEKYDAASALLTDIEGEFEPSDNLINTAVQAERFDLVSRLWQIRVEADPTDVQSWASYAASFHMQGDSDTAVTILEEGKAQLPAAAADFDQLLAQVEAER